MTILNWRGCYRWQNPLRGGVCSGTCTALVALGAAVSDAGDKGERDGLVLHPKVVRRMVLRMSSAPVRVAALTALRRREIGWARVAPGRRRGPFYACAAVTRTVHPPCCARR